LGYLNVYFGDLKPHFGYIYFGYFNAYRASIRSSGNLNFGDLNSDLRYMDLDLWNSEVHFLNGFEYFGYLNLKIPEVLPQFTVGDLSLPPSDKSTYSRFRVNQNW
jgi:hypothetical protein